MIAMQHFSQSEKEFYRNVIFYFFEKFQENMSKMPKNVAIISPLFLKRVLRTFIHLSFRF